MILEKHIEKNFETEVRGLAIQYLLSAMKQTFETDPDLDYQIIKFTKSHRYYGPSELEHQIDLTKRLIESNDDLLKILLKERTNYDLFVESSYFYQFLFESLSIIFKKNKMKILGYNESKHQYSVYHIVWNRNLELFVFDRRGKKLIEVKDFKFQ